MPVFTRRSVRLEVVAPTPDEIAVNLDRVGHRFDGPSGRTEILRDINIQIKSGEFFTVLGPSGSSASMKPPTMFNNERGLATGRKNKSLWRSPMRAFIFAIAAIVPAFARDWARADEVPEFDIVRNCKVETSDAGIEGPAHCTSDETEAKNQLAKRWSSYSASQKKELRRRERHRGRQELRRTFDLPRNVGRRPI
jgi:hypothetical protein